MKKDFLFILLTVVIGSILIITEINMLSKQMTEELEDFNSKLDAKIELIQVQSDYNLQRYYK